VVNRFRAAFQSLIGIDFFLLKTPCREHGLIGIYQLDGHIPPFLSPNEQVRCIYTANVEAIVGADSSAHRLKLISSAFSIHD
jgi:hypothetical protein